MNTNTNKNEDDEELDQIDLEPLNLKKNKFSRKPSLEKEVED
jgi:hypothetical protein